MEVPRHEVFVTTEDRILYLFDLLPAVGAAIGLIVLLGLFHYWRRRRKARAGRRQSQQTPWQE
jgi:hypothetical protein